MSFDLGAAERFVKPEKGQPLWARAHGDLRWAAGEAKAGGHILIDTTVYLDALQGKTPPAVDDLLRYRKIFHSSVCVSELTHAIGRLDPTNAKTAGILQKLRDTINDIPRQRLFAPDVDAWGKSGMLAGKVMRLAGMGQSQADRRKLQNDSLIYLQARNVGAAVLTRNRQDFDYLNQLVPTGAVIFY